MTWKIRHEGSPRAMEGLTLPQVIEGMQDGQWEPTDEVLGPEDQTWTPIENHPQLAEIAAEIDPLPLQKHPDETRLDMNPLIDVALVLLIFFILTTTYESIRQGLEMHGMTAEDVKGQPIPKVEWDIVEAIAIKVTVIQKDGKPVIYVEDKEVAEKNLTNVLRQYVGDTHKTKVILFIEDDVPWRLDAWIRGVARRAGITEVLEPVAPPAPP